LPQRLRRQPQRTVGRPLDQTLIPQLPFQLAQPTGVDRSLVTQLPGECIEVLPPIRQDVRCQILQPGHGRGLENGPVEIGRWQTENNQLLAVSADPQARALPGKETREPAFGVSARWIAPALEEQALAAGYSVVDPTTVITMHLSELVRRHGHELLSRAETKRLIDTLNDSHPKLIEELIPKVMTLGDVQRVLQQLLREQVSIRDLGTILEVLVEAAPANKALPYLVELCRQAMGRRLVQPHLDADGALPVLLLDPAIDEELQSCFGDGGRNISDRSALSMPVIRRGPGRDRIISRWHSMLFACPTSSTSAPGP